MTISQSLRNRAVVIEKYVTLAAASGTTTGVSVPAGTLVIAAGFEPKNAIADVSAYTIDITDGTTTFANDLSLDAAAAGTIVVGTTAGLVAAADTVDVVTTITGSPGEVEGRVFVVAIDVNDCVREGTAAIRDAV
jgi:hypothetical protein